MSAYIGRDNVKRGQHAKYRPLYATSHGSALAIDQNGMIINRSAFVRQRRSRGIRAQSDAAHQIANAAKFEVAFTSTTDQSNRELDVWRAWLATGNAVGFG